MGYIKTRKDGAGVFHTTRKEIEYERVDVFGGVLSFWRRINEVKLGEELCVEINGHLEEYDRLIVNGKEIPIPDKITRRKNN